MSEFDTRNYYYEQEEASSARDRIRELRAALTKLWEMADATKGEAWVARIARAALRADDEKEHGTNA